MAAINSALPVIKGFRIRATRVGRCGLPIQGAKNQIVTDGFIEFGLERETSDGDEIEVKNASGVVCASDRTDDQFKRYNLSLQLCGIHPELIAMFTDQPVVLDAGGDVAGLLQQTGANENGYVALELWAGTGGGDDCEVPENDDIFKTVSDGTVNGQWWYMLLPWVRGGVLGDITVNGTDSAEITISAYTGSGAHWGQGPYNVVEGVSGQPGRLTAPIPARTHMLLQRTTVAPPKVTHGLAELAMPQPYFGTTDGAGGRRPNPPAESGDNTPGAES